MPSNPDHAVGSSSPAPYASAFLVGQDPAGRWVAVEEHGRTGGFFRTKDAAAHFAAFETDHRPGAVRLASEPVTLRL